MTNASQTAFDPSAPAEERVGALSELQKAAMPTAMSDLLPSDAIRDVISHINAGYEEEVFRKSMNSNIVPFPSNRLKNHERGMQSVLLDDWQLSIQGDYYERPSAMGFDALRAMVDQTPVLNAVMLTRIRQIQRFCRVSESNADAPGFEIRHIDKKHQITTAETESIQLLNRFMSNCGWEFNPRRRKALRRDGLAPFMAKAVRDSLTLDSVGIETEWKRDKKLGLDGFYLVDGGTIRLCTELGYKGDDEIYALQVVQGRVCTAYSYEDLIYEARNPRSDVRVAGYGLPETELLIRVVTGFLNAMTYNIKGFDNNAIPKGMLHLSGNYTTDDLNAFKRYWNSMVKGINNQWSLPVMVSKDQESKASFEKFGVDFNEMYFSKWMTFLTSIICAVYGMSPAEINFDSFTAGSSSALSGSDTAEKLAASKDSGLRPILSYFENLFTDFIMQEFSDKYVFRWTGLDPRDAAQRFEMRKMILTVNESRAEEGYDALPGPLGDAPLNPSLISPWLQLEHAPEPQQPDFGDPSAGYNPSGEQKNNENGNEDDGEAGNDDEDNSGSTVTPNDESAPDKEERELDFGKALPTVYVLQ